MTLKHVQRGDPLRIPAGDWNKIVDATRAFLEHQALGGSNTLAIAGIRQASVSLVKNDSGVDQERFAVLGIDAPIIAPADHEEEFKRQVALSCVAPTEAAHGAGSGRFVILLEPLAVGAVGRAAVAGVSVARIEIANDTGTRADVIDGDSTKLATATSGAAQVLWREDVDTSGGPATGWAIIRFGGSGGEGPMMIKLTGASQLTANRWAYSAVEQVPEKQGRYKDKLGGWTGTAYNTVEANNASTGIQGSGDDVVDFPQGVELQPLGAGAVVPAWRIINCEGIEEVHFSAPNNPGGSCPT
jgi:hypothetical protein